MSRSPDATSPPPHSLRHPRRLAMTDSIDVLSIPIHDGTQTGGWVRMRSQDAAHFWGCSPRSADRRLASGSLPAGWTVLEAPDGAKRNEPQRWLVVDARVLAVGRVSDEPTITPDGQELRNARTLQGMSDTNNSRESLTLKDTPDGGNGQLSPRNGRMTDTSTAIPVGQMAVLDGSFDTRRAAPDGSSVASDSPGGVVDSLAFMSDAQHVPSDGGPEMLRMKVGQLEATIAGAVRERDGERERREQAEAREAWLRERVEVAERENEQLRATVQGLLERIPKALPPARITWWGRLRGRGGESAP
jgi:hypothetical protein